MTRCAAALFLATAWGLASAAPPRPVPPVPTASFTSDTMEYRQDSGETVFRGHCRYRDGSLLITADEIDNNTRTRVLVAIGRADMTYGDERLLADRLELNRADGTFKADNVRVGRYPFYIEGRTADGTRTEIFIHHASITYTDPGKWKPSIKAETIEYSPGHYLRMVRSLVGLHGEEIIPLGAFRQDLTSVFATPYLSFAVGYRSTLGGTADVGLRVPVLPDVKAGGDLGVFTKRGVMVGPSADYFDPKNPEELYGWFRSGWISDFGQRFVDVLNDPVPRNREYAEWTHQERINDHLTLDGEVNWWSDSDVIRDFDPKRFYQNSENPDSYLEPLYTGDNYFASVFARFRPNTWEATQERLPEFSYNLLPTALGAGFYQRLETSAAYLREVPPVAASGFRQVGSGSAAEYLTLAANGGPTLSADRIDAFYELSYPWAPNNWFNLTPVAGARVTDYSSTEGAAEPGGYLRTLGEVGFDAQLRSSGTYNYDNPVWDINGLRHLMTPTLSYRYIPNGSEGRDFIPQIDRQSFTTYLEPLDLGDIRYIDQIHTENTLRLGLDNTLQTRQEGYGSRDLLYLNFADDLNFHRSAEEPDISDFHTDLALMPAPWLEYDVTEIVNPASWTLREFTSSLVLKDGDVWSLHLGNDFVRHEDNNYIVETMLRLNEQYQTTFLAVYDSRLRAFDRVAVGLVENLANTWKIDYLLVFNGGPNREGRVNFQVQLDILRF